ncbi:hypothetical protein D3C83_194600 [compost metagenome]
MLRELFDDVVLDLVTDRRKRRPDAGAPVHEPSRQAFRMRATRLSATKNASQIPR